jgi:hypothetical protein
MGVSAAGRDPSLDNWHTLLADRGSEYVPFCSHSDVIAIRSKLVVIYGQFGESPNGDAG